MAPVLNPPRECGPIGRSLVTLTVFAETRDEELR